MKALKMTSMMVVAVALLLALTATVAMAAPGGGYYPSDEVQIDPATLQQLQEMVNDGTLNDGLIPDGGDEEYVVPPDDLPDDSIVDDGEDDGIIDDGEDGGIDDGTPGDVDDSADDSVPQPPLPTQENNNPPSTSSKLPNTGTQLAIVAGFGMALLLTALVIRHYAMKRARIR